MSAHDPHGEMTPTGFGNNSQPAAGDGKLSPEVEAYESAETDALSREEELIKISEFSSPSKADAKWLSSNKDFVKLLLFASGRDSALHATNQNANAALLKVTSDCLDNLEGVFNVGGTSLNDVLDPKHGRFVDYAHYLDGFLCNLAVWGSLPSGKTELILGDGGTSRQMVPPLGRGGGESGLSGSEELLDTLPLE